MLPSTGHHTPCGTNEREKMDACFCALLMAKLSEMKENVYSNSLFDVLKKKMQQISVTDCN